MSPLAHILRGAVIVYRYSLSAFLGQGCRFRPTCSEYALDALAAHGALRGGLMALRRIFRCHPWGGSGLDPVPAPKKGPPPADVAARRHHLCGQERSVVDPTSRAI